MKAHNILGYEVQPDTQEGCKQAISTVLDADERDCAWVACINPHSYAVARKDADFAVALRAADWLVPDGIGVIIASRLLGKPLRERVTGFDVFESVMKMLNEKNGSVFFLGSSEETLRLISKRLLTDFPNVQLAGVFSPPFKDEFSEDDNDAMILAITRSNPDVLWVGLTAPKQEKWISENRHRIPVKFAGAIGAVFDFYSGKVKRSHPSFQRAGLEWLPRLLQEPRRLWRRMFVSAPIFLFDVAVARVSLTIFGRKDSSEKKH